MMNLMYLGLDLDSCWTFFELVYNSRSLPKHILSQTKYWISEDGLPNFWEKWDNEQLYGYFFRTWCTWSTNFNHIRFILLEWTYLFKITVLLVGLDYPCTRRNDSKQVITATLSLCTLPFAKTFNLHAVHSHLVIINIFLYWLLLLHKWDLSVYRKLADLLNMYLFSGLRYANYSWDGSDCHLSRIMVRMA